MALRTSNGYGAITVSDEVVASIAGKLALECYGVVGMAAPNAVDGIAKILPASRLRRGVVVSSTEAGVHVELYVVIEYGTNISAVSQKMRRARCRFSMPRMLYRPNSFLRRRIRKLLV